MSFVYEKAITKIVNGTIDLTTADVRTLLVGATTTADTEFETEFLAGFTTLDELTAVTNYARVACTSEAVNEDLPNNRAEFDFDDVVYSALGNGVNGTIQAMVVYIHVTTDADSIPFIYMDNAGSSFAQATNGSDITFQIDAQGAAQFTRA